MKFRIKGRFVSFKDYLKQNGTAGIKYKDLSSSQKKSYSLKKRYEEGQSIVKDGKHYHLKKHEFHKLKEDAKESGGNVRQIFSDDPESILDFYRNGNISFKQYQTSFQKTIKDFKGSFVLNGNKVSRAEFLKELAFFNSVLKSNEKIATVKYPFKMVKGMTEIQISLPDISKDMSLEELSEICEMAGIDLIISP